MKGDFTRMTFDRTKHYSRVLQQQGRVQVDADWNEMADINRHLLRRLAADLIGPHGGPGDGFKISHAIDMNDPDVEPRHLVIVGGHYYVDGILCENDRLAQSLLGQPAFPIPSDDELEKDGSYFLYLDVWERHVTDIEDEDQAKIGIREVALRGPDTSTRTQTVWQVRTRKAIGRDPDSEFNQFIESQNQGAGAALRARAIKPPADDEACLISPEARYRGAENQLYRVEIHHPGPTLRGDDKTPPDIATVATFKWSRENGSVIFPITKRQGDVVTLRNLGRDSRFGIHPDDWVEIVDDDYVLQNRAEPLLQVKEVDRDNLRVTLKRGPASQVGSEPEKHPLLRRWDHQSGGLHDGAIPVVSLGPTEDPDSRWVITLEDGIQVQIKAQTLRTGDYWLIPARVATGDVDWPGPPGEPFWRPADGIEHKYAPLAKLTLSGGKIKVADIKDLRRTIIQLWK